MTEPISLHLGVMPEPRPYDALGLITPPYEFISPGVRRTVNVRDEHTCRFCGFLSRKYQLAVALAGNPRDVDGAVTACIFCYQVAYLDSVAATRSGLLIWLPEVSQVELHHLARQIYVWRIATGSRGERGRLVYDRLIERRNLAKQHLGTDVPLHLAQRLKSRRHEPPDSGLDAALAGIRLFPLARRIIREADLEFNQFPQILAYWRSRQGSLATIDYYPGVADIERFLLEPAELEAIDVATSESVAERGVPHGMIAAKLLRNAAAFFLTLARQNPDLKASMIDKANAFERRSYRVEGEPTAETPEGTHATLAAKLLREAATLFRSIAEQNSALREQMTQNAKIFDYVSDRVSNEPLGRMPE